MTLQAKRKDTNQLAHSIAQQATGQAPSNPARTPAQRAAALLGRRGGLKGGKARAAKLTGKRRSEIARRAAKARWKARRDS